MPEHGIIFTIFLVFSGAALLATAALYARQALLIAYILLGTLVGPAGLGWIEDARAAHAMSDIGIVFLLFLLGLNLLPQKLIQMLRQATLVTVGSSLVFALIGGAVALWFGFSLGEAAIVAACMTFSSTILGLKLLPTTALHHRHAGEIIISILLIQDLIAIVILLALQNTGSELALGLVRIMVGLPGLIAGALLGERFLIRPLLHRFDRIQEYVFLLAIGWCMACAQAAEWLGLSYEIGAFVAGVALASSPIARFIAESLKPLRDFFLVMFFFALGAGLSLELVIEVALPAVLLAGLMMAIKPPVFAVLLRQQAEKPALAREMGVRLGQVSEFSLLIAALALEVAVIGARAAHLIEVTVIFSFVISSYWIVLRYPTPIAASDALRRD